MDFDPLSRDLAAPRYELESGSEDEYDQKADSSSTSPSAVTVKTRTGGASQLPTGLELLVLLGDAGRACLDPRSLPLEESIVVVGEEQQASVATSSKQVLIHVSPSQEFSQRRYHELVDVLLGQLQPSSMVIVDSYSPAQRMFHEEEAEQASDSLRYLASPSFPQSRIQKSSMISLKAPEAVAGLGAAFLSAAVLADIPALIALLEDVSFHSHVQLYGSAHDTGFSARLSTSSSQALRALISHSDSTTASQSPRKEAARTIVDFAKHRRLTPGNLTLGDGNMYI